MAVKEKGRGREKIRCRNTNTIRRKRDMKQDEGKPLSNCERTGYKKKQTPGNKGGSGMKMIGIIPTRGS